MITDPKGNGTAGGKVSDFEPCYLALLRSGELATRVEQAREHMKDCDLCARYCRVDRIETIRGAICRTGERAVVNSFGPHHGEEEGIVTLPNCSCMIFGGAQVCSSGSGSGLPLAHGGASELT